MPFIVFGEGRLFVAYTPALDLSTSAKTYKEVRARFDEIVQIFFQEIIDKGTFEETLQDLGWKKLRKAWSPPRVVAQDTKRVTIPLPAPT